MNAFDRERSSNATDEARRCLPPLPQGSGDERSSSNHAFHITTNEASRLPDVVEEQGTNGVRLTMRRTSSLTYMAICPYVRMGPGRTELVLPCSTHQLGPFPMW